MTIEEEIERLDKKMEDCIKDIRLPKRVEEYKKKYGNISEIRLIKRFTI